ncbi:MAG: tetratricopeptide repeat protein [Gallionella sp.]|nr:tetratricopeptide repeat protein [Gallionella sp.]MDD4946543.1 tetratricopeptide repeat protein [Gallionella sp.]
MKNWRLLLAGFCLLASSSAFAGELSEADEQELQRAEQLSGLIVELYGRGEYQQALGIAQQVLVIKEKVRSPDHADIAESLNDIAVLYQALGQYNHALPLYQRVLAIREKVLGPEHADTAISLNNLAVMYKILGQYDRALPLYQRALTIREKVLGPEHADTAISLNNLAVMYKILGQYDQALPLHLRTLAIREKALGPEHVDTATALNELGILYELLGQYDKSLALKIRVLAIYEKALGPEHPWTSTSLNNLAGLYDTLGQYDKALPLYQRALAIYEKALGPEHPNTATALNNLAELYRTHGQYELALPLYLRALAIDEKSLIPEHPDLASDMNNLALLYKAIGQYDQALPLYQRALAIHEKVLGPEHASTATSLNNLALLYEALGQYDQALPLYQRALRISEAAGLPETLMGVQSSLGGFYKARQQPPAAIFFYKQAVNTMQQLRRQSAKLDREMQKSLLSKNEGVYQKLSGLLMDESRIAEAQQVLAMLKEDEYFDFIQRSQNETGLDQRASYNGVEAPWAARFQQIGGQLAQLGKEIAELRKRGEKLPLSKDEQTHLAQLEKDLEVAGQAFDAAMNGMLASLKEDAVRDEASRKIDEGGSRQELLGSLGQNTVLLQYLPLEDKLSIIVTTPTVRIARFAQIDEKALNQKITAYRGVLQNPRQDPAALAQELYGYLIKPVEEDLKQAGAQQIMLSLNGALRYLPFTALHDGQHYLVENYALSLYNEAAADKLDKANTQGWKVWGLGVTKAHENFSALASVKGELGGIVGQGGIIGETRLDEQFTEQALKDGVGQHYPVLHIASHFKFTPGTMSDSFLLLGDGGHLTLQDVKAKLDLKGVDLVTLSACETAFGGGRDANGREVEGMGAIMQKKGAKSVMATLWPVADASTAQLMQNFYRLRDKEHLNKAQALRQAQLALLRGKGGAIANGGERGPKRTGGEGAAYAADASAPYSHPYYWAPFILMGNWL